MVHGYHVILPAYGFWLPNDPRGSWSDFIGRWELLRFGPAQRTDERRSLGELTDAEMRLRDEARAALKYPPVTFDGLQARAIGHGFALQCRTSRYTIWACSILPEHCHLVIARHTYAAERMVNLLKGASTRQIIDEGRHPLAAHAEPGRRPPRMWGEHQWIEYLDSEAAIENAIRYVEENPVREGKPPQRWSFVTAFTGIEAGHVTYH